MYFYTENHKCSFNCDQYKHIECLCCLYDSKQYLNSPYKLFGFFIVYCSIFFEIRLKNYLKYMNDGCLHKKQTPGSLNVSLYMMQFNIKKIIYGPVAIDSFEIFHYPDYLYDIFYHNISFIP